MDDPNDPGWRPRLAAGTPDGLLLLRSMFVSFCAAIVLIGVATVLIVGDADGSVSPALGVLLTALAGFVAQTVARSFDRPLDCSSDQALAGSYRTRFFLRLAFSEVAALVGFVLSILSGSLLPYVVGMVGTLAGFARLAPTTAHLEADQQALTVAGCGRSLVPALREGFSR